MQLKEFLAEKRSWDDLPENFITAVSMLLLNPSAQETLNELVNTEDDPWEHLKVELYRGMNWSYVIGAKEIIKDPKIASSPRNVLLVATRCTGVILHDPTRRPWLELDGHFQRCLNDIVTGNVQSADYDDINTPEYEDLNLYHSAQAAYATAILFPEQQDDMRNRSDLWGALYEQVQEDIRQKDTVDDMIQAVAILRLLSREHSTMTFPAETISWLEEEIEKLRMVDTLNPHRFIENKFFFTIFNDPDAHLTPEGQIVVHVPQQPLAKSVPLPQRHHA